MRRTHLCALRELSPTYASLQGESIYELLAFLRSMDDPLADASSSSAIEEQP